MDILFGVMIYMGGWLLGAYLDIRLHVEAPALFWMIGALGGLGCGIMISG